MIAEEIRKMTPGEFERDHMEFICAMLQEVAAQLAELNEAFRGGKPSGLSVILCASNDDIPVRVKP